jgi:hypothetical protein
MKSALVKSYALILSFQLLFLYLTGIGNYLFGIDVPCIGVCNKYLIDKLYLISPMIAGSLVAIVLIYKNNYEQVFEYIKSKKIYLFILIALFFSCAILYFWDFDNDDKWMGYRITKNVIELGFPNWNAEEKINISTSLIWPYIGSLAHYFHDWNTGIKIIGISFYFACIFLIYKMKFKGSDNIYLLLFGFITYIPAYLWFLGGIETSLAIFWGLLVVYIFNRYGPEHILGWLVLSLGILVRPEFILASIYPLFHLIIFHRKQSLKITAIAFFICSIAFWLSYNKLLFNNWLPTPAYIKSFAGHIIFQNGQSKIFIIGNGVVHLISSICISIFLLISYISALFYTFQTIKNKFSSARLASSEGQISHQESLVMIFLGFLSINIYHAYSGYMHMGFTFRYLLPANIAILAIGALLLRENSSVAKKTMLLLSVQAGVFITSLIFVFGGEFSLTRAKYRDGFSLSNYASFMQPWVKIGNTLHGLAKPGDRLWAKDGTNLAGSALSGMYSLDGLLTPLSYSVFPEIRNCQGFDCAKYFDYIFLQNTDIKNWPELVESPKNYSIIIENPTIIVLKNLERK